MFFKKEDNLLYFKIFQNTMKWEKKCLDNIPMVISLSGLILLYFNPIYFYTLISRIDTLIQ